MSFVSLPWVSTDDKPGRGLNDQPLVTEVSGLGATIPEMKLLIVDPHQSFMLRIVLTGLSGVVCLLCSPRGGAVLLPTQVDSLNDQTTATILRLLVRIFGI